MQASPLARALVAEAIGTFALVPVLGASLGGLAYQFVRGEQTHSTDAQADVAQREQGA